MIVEQQCHYGKKKHSKVRTVTYFNKVVLLGEIFDVKTNGNDFFGEILYQYEKNQYAENTGIGSETV